MSSIFEKVNLAMSKWDLNLLKELGNDPEINRIYLPALISQACEKNNKEMVEVLYDNMNYAYDVMFYYKALKYAVELENFELIKLLKEKNPDAPDFFGSSILISIEKQISEIMEDAQENKQKKLKK